MDVLANAWVEESIQGQLDGTTQNAGVFNDLAGIFEGCRICPDACPVPGQVEGLEEGI